VSARSILGRVVLATVLTAVATSVTLATLAAVIAASLWGARERSDLAKAASSVVEAIRVDAAEDGDGHDMDETLREHMPSGYRGEVWRSSSLVSEIGDGPRLGPPGTATSEEWIAQTHPLPGGGTLIVAIPRERQAAALRLFAGSLLLAAPLCLGLAIVVGRMVGRRATRPLALLQQRIFAARPGVPLSPWGLPGAPAEAVAIDQAFGELWGRLDEAMKREAAFAAEAAHELRTPLTRLRLHAERAAADAGPAGRREVVAQVEEIDRLARLVDSLLVLSRDAVPGLQQSEVVNMADLVRRSILRPGDGPEFVLDLPDEALVRGDEALLGVAVENLVENARKFARAGRVQVALADAGGRVLLSVITPGARIPVVERERLFERFYRSADARATSDGHGLGLPLARHVARLHGGDVRCESAAEDDALFLMELPAWNPRDAPPSAG
jgi:signal transduction histidine kinase